MADGDHCHSIVIDGDRIVFNRPMYLSVYYEQHEGDFVPGGLVLTFWDNQRREEPNQPERPMSPLQQIAANEEPLPPAQPAVPLAPSEEPEDFLLYDYYDTEYSDTEDYDTGDSDQDEFDPGIGGSESGNKQRSAEEEQDQHRDGGSRKRAREDDEEEEEEEERRSSQRFRPDCDSVLGNFQTEAAAFPHTGAASRGEPSSVVHMESMVHIDSGGEEGQEDNMEKLLPIRSTKGGGSQEGADENQRALPLHSWRPPFMMAFSVFLLVGFQTQEGLITWYKVQQGGKTQF